MSVENRLLELIAERFQRDRNSLSPEDDIFASLEINSLQTVELITELEEHFGVELPDYELQRVKTFAQLAEVIQQRV